MTFWLCTSIIQTEEHLLHYKRWGGLTIRPVLRNSNFSCLLHFQAFSSSLVNGGFTLLLFYDFIYISSDILLSWCKIIATSNVHITPEENFLLNPNLNLESTRQIIGRNWWTMKLDKTRNLCFSSMRALITSHIF